MFVRIRDLSNSHCRRPRAGAEDAEILVRDSHGLEDLCRSCKRTTGRRKSCRTQTRCHHSRPRNARDGWHTRCPRNSFKYACRADSTSHQPRVFNISVRSEKKWHTRGRQQERIGAGISKRSGSIAERATLRRSGFRRSISSRMLASSRSLTSSRIKTNKLRRNLKPLNPNVQSLHRVRDRGRYGAVKRRHTGRGWLGLSRRFALCARAGRASCARLPFVLGFAL
jgi:hypothetical protein